MANLIAHLQETSIPVLLIKNFVHLEMQYQSLTSFTMKS